jgi:NADH-quinone oxidoreductase subunit N
MTSGFIGKFSIFSAAYQSGSLATLIAGVLSSAIAAFFYIRVIVLMFFKDPVQDGTSVVIPSALTTTTITISAVVTLALGIFPAPLINFIASTAVFLR